MWLSGCLNIFIQAVWPSTVTVRETFSYFSDILRAIFETYLWSCLLLPLYHEKAQTSFWGETHGKLYKINQ